MYNHKNPRSGTHADDQKPILLARVIRIVKHASTRIIKNAPCLLKPDPMLGPIALVLGFIPLKAKHWKDFIYVLSRYQAGNQTRAPGLLYAEGDYLCGGGEKIDAAVVRDLLGGSVGIDFVEEPTELLMPVLTPSEWDNRPMTADTPVSPLPILYLTDN